MNRHLSIVHVIPALTKGGAERVTVDLANASVRDGHKVTVVAVWKVDEQVLRARLDPAVHVIYMIETPAGRLQRYVIGLAWVLRNRRWLVTQDVLHVHLTQSSVLGTLVYTLRNWARASKPAVVETYHSVGMKIPDRLRAFHAWNCRHRDALAVMALNPFWSNFIARNPRLLAVHIPNGVDAPVGKAAQDSVRAYLETVGVPNTATRIIGTVGQFRPSRQPRSIARILMGVLKCMPNDVHAIMCGSGPELDAVRALVAAEGLSERFTLPGAVNDPWLVMSAMSVYLTINVGPITGIAALEAAFCGVPVVALQVEPASKPVCEEWIWSSDDPEALSDRITTMLDASETLAQVAKDQQEHAIAEYSVYNMYMKYIALYREAITAQSTPGALPPGIWIV